MSIRIEKKQQTRQQLLAAALRLANEMGGFSAVSLREVTREVNLVPTAFYRHFKDMEELGLVLVDESCLTLRRLLREARMQSSASASLVITHSVSVYLNHVRDYAGTFEFLARERSGGSQAIREAIAREVHYFIAELAADLRQYDVFRDFPAEDLEMIGSLVVNTIAQLALEILRLPPHQSRLIQDMETRALKQLRLIFIGAMHWKPSSDEPDFIT